MAKAIESGSKFSLYLSPNALVLISLALGHPLGNGKSTVSLTHPLSVVLVLTNGGCCTGWRTWVGFNSQSSCVSCIVSILKSSSEARTSRDHFVLSPDFHELWCSVTSVCPFTEVKLQWAKVVLGWVTPFEHYSCLLWLCGSYQ